MDKSVYGADGFTLTTHQFMMTTIKQTSVVMTLKQHNFVPEALLKEAKAIQTVCAVTASLALRMNCDIKTPYAGAEVTLPQMKGEMAIGNEGHRVCRNTGTKTRHAKQTYTTQNIK